MVWAGCRRLRCGFRYRASIPILRISVATDFGVNLLSPILGDFLLEYPDITVNMVLNNRYVELISEGFDMAIRVGELEDSSLRARKLTETTKRMIGAPSYFQKFGRPQKIDDLNDHKLLHYSNQANGNVWKITAPSGDLGPDAMVRALTGSDLRDFLPPPDQAPPMGFRRPRQPGLPQFVGRFGSDR